MSRRTYGRIPSHFWEGKLADGIRKAIPAGERRLRARLVLQYLMSAPASHSVGLYGISLSTIARHTELTAPDVDAAFEDLRAARLAYYDRDMEVVYIPDMAEVEHPTGVSPTDKNHLSITRYLEEMRRSKKIYPAFARKHRERFHLGGERAEPEAGLATAAEAAARLRERLPDLRDAPGLSPAEQLAAAAEAVEQQERVLLIPERGWTSRDFTNLFRARAGLPPLPGDQEASGEGSRGACPGAFGGASADNRPESLTDREGPSEGPSEHKRPEARGQRPEEEAAAEALRWAPSAAAPSDGSYRWCFELGITGRTSGQVDQFQDTLEALLKERGQITSLVIPKASEKREEIRRELEKLLQGLEPENLAKACGEFMEREKTFSLYKLIVSAQDRVLNGR